MILGRTETKWREYGTSYGAVLDKFRDYNVPEGHDVVSVEINRYNYHYLQPWQVIVISAKIEREGH